MKQLAEVNTRGRGTGGRFNKKIGKGKGREVELSRGVKEEVASRGER